MMVEPGYLFQRRQFDILTRFTRRTTMNHFCLVQGVDRFSLRVIVAVAPAAIRIVGFGEPEIIRRLPLLDGRRRLPSSASRLSRP